MEEIALNGVKFRIESSRVESSTSRWTYLCLSCRVTDGRTRFKAASKCLAQIQAPVVLLPLSSGAVPVPACELLLLLLLLLLSLPLVLLSAEPRSVLDDGTSVLIPPILAAVIPPWDPFLSPMSLLLLIISLTTARPASLTRAARSAPLKPAREKKERIQSNWSSITLYTLWPPVT